MDKLKMLIIEFHLKFNASLVTKTKQIINGNEETIYVPIGIKPQNLNFNYTYSNETKNQLIKWMEVGFADNFTLPTPTNTVVNYEDSSQPIALRA